jgi:hypothetical protein
MVDYSRKEVDPNPQIPFQRQVLSGLLLYQPPSFTYQQYARWVEATKYKRNPIAGAFSQLRRHFLSLDDGFDPMGIEWHAALVMMAIPFAAGVVTVITPDQFTLPRIVTDYAARHGVQINQAPLSYFPKEEVV